MKGLAPRVASNEVEGGSRQFRLEASWVMEASCEVEVEKLWNSASGSVHDKLNFIGEGLSNWGRSLLTDNLERQKLLEEELERLHSLPLSEEVLCDTMQRRLELNLEIDKQEVHWEQRAHRTWMREGDKNTTFYHRAATQRRRKNRIKGVEDNNGQWCDPDNKVAEIASSYFQDLFTTNGVSDNTHLMSGVRNVLPPHLNVILTKEYTKEEIWEAVKDMDPLKAPGCDGIPALFYQRYWHIISAEVSNFCLGIIHQDLSMEGHNHTNIVLIPKINTPRRIAQYRAISLCSVLFKIVSKVIANRLRMVLDVCIDEAQSGFVPGRLISDNIVVAYELIHSIRTKNSGKKGKFALKLDMSKAYDRGRKESLH